MIAFLKDKLWRYSNLWDYFVGVWMNFHRFSTNTILMNIESTSFLEHSTVINPLSIGRPLILHWRILTFFIPLD